MQSPRLDLLTLSQTEDKLSVQLKSRVLLDFCCCHGSMQINGRYLVNHGQTGNLGCAEPRGRESRLWELNLVNKYHPQSGLQFLGLRDALVTGRFLRRAW
jgi:hypothetical protein